MSVNIANINKVALLKALWNSSKPDAFFTFFNCTPPPFFNETEANTAVTSYIDCFCGHLIKADISGDTADPSGYDRDFGSGAFQRVVDSM
jgi:hypothetical protein